MDRFMATLSGKWLPVVLVLGLLMAVPAALGGETAASRGTPRGRRKGVWVLDSSTGLTVEAAALPTAKMLALRPGDVQGTVKGADGDPLNKLRIQLLDPATGKVVEKVKTDSNGQYTLNKVSEGQYVVLIGSPGVAAVLDVSLKAENPPAAVNIVVPAAAMAGPGRRAPRPPPVLLSVGSSTADAVVLVGSVFEPGAGVVARTPDSSAETVPLAVRPPPVRPPLPPPLSPIMP